VVHTSILRAARLLLGLLTLTALGWQLGIQLRLGHSVLNFFSYFTNLSNLFASVLLVALSFGAIQRGDSPGARDQLRLMSTANMTIVGVMFVALLRDVDLGALLPWINVVLHYVMPCAIVIDWVIEPPSRRLGSRQLLVALVPPLCYVAYTLVRGSIVDWYPYPFLNPGNVGGYGVVATYALGIAATYVITAYALVTLGNRSKHATQ
jgi:hypothetical protein